MTNKQIDFAAGLNELEAITAWFESEEIDLDEALAKFERGMQLAVELKSHLSVIENKVELIKQKFAAPAAQAEPEGLADKEGDSGPDPDLFSQPPAES